MLIRPPPEPPCWIMYPEPERTRLELAYREEHAKYCAEMDRDILIEFSAFGMGAMIMLAMAIWAVL